MNGDAAFSLQGRVALVTGATRGIGASIARRFVASGARVATTHRGSERNERLSTALVAELGEDPLLPIVADAGDDQQMAAAVELTAERFAPGVDTVIANAADTGKLPWDDTTIKQCDRMMAAKLRGAFVLALPAIEGMRQRGYGKIITVRPLSARRHRRLASMMVAARRA